MRLSTIILFLLILSTVKQGFCGQNQFVSDTIKHSPKKHPSKKEMGKLIAEDEKNWKPYYDNCVFVNKYSIKQRLKKYPYSKAAKILAVSYKCWCFSDVEPDIQLTTDTATTQPVKEATAGLIIHNDTVDYSKMIEVKQLSQKQINRLTYVIYNTDFRVHQRYEPALYENGGGGCFDPRNALVFLDKNGKVFDYIEVCFECHVADSKSGKITLGAGCEQKFELIRQYLINIGIKYGTVNKD